MIYSILNDRDDKTDVSLIFANVSEKDIILKDELDGLAKRHANFHVWWVSLSHLYACSTLGVFWFRILCSTAIKLMPNA